MAKRKRKKKNAAPQLKYEVYGILLITISIIALSGEAAVGRSLSMLFGLILGKFYFVLALVGVYIGLAAMVKRAWPKGWSTRKTGLLVLVLAFTLSSSISEINSRFEVMPREEWTSGLIFNELNTQIKGELLGDNEVTQAVSIRDKRISGGYVGALQYTAMFSLFGYYGAILLMLVMFAISIMLLTGRSYVEIIRALVKRGMKVSKLLKAKQAQWKKKRAAARKANKAKLAVVPPLKKDEKEPEQWDDEEDDYYDEEEQREDETVAAKADKRTGLLFSWKNVADRWQKALFSEQKQLEQDSEEQLSKKEQEAAGQADVLNSQPDVIIDRETGEILPSSDYVAGNSSHSKPANNNSSLTDDESVSALSGEWNAETYESFEQEDAVQDSVQNTDNYPSDDGDFSSDHHFDTGQQNSIDYEADYMQVDSGYEDHFIPSIPKENGALPEESDSEAIVTAAEVSDFAARRPMEQSIQPEPYMLPPFSLLVKPSGSGKAAEANDLFDSRRKLEATLESFGVRAKVLDVVRGPAVTRYEVQPASGVKVSRIVGLTDDIALALAAKDIRMEAPIPGKSAIGIEVPNMEVSIVTMREVMETPAFQNAPSKLSIAFGRDISGQTIVGNLAKMPHLLVAGATGSGKSVCINGIITSILYKAMPDEVKFLMIDPKMVELNVYNGIPHLLAPVVTDPRRASLALKKIVVEMEKRYELFSKSATRNIEGYNTLMADNPAAILPYIVVIVDELADLMMVAANDVEDSIARLAQMARAAGIHLIIATQRPSVDVITGVIKANIPSRIAFGVSSQVDSRTILDSAGAEKLLGRGDMLFLPVGMSKPIRVQGAFLSDSEVEALVSFTSKQAEAEYKEDLVPEIEDEAEQELELDELYPQAVQIVVEAKQASVSLLQRRMRVGYTRAARLIDQMEAKGVVGPYEGSKPREVLMTAEQIQAN